ncbi:uncharacterized protein [Hemitrygon akajei]|uniref:uncharacterized protein isoform X2 n=1 Tax=Hemitrygon akajei TaxID=2704970 RepID=UPI003BFA174D
MAAALETNREDAGEKWSQDLTRDRDSTKPRARSIEDRRPWRNGRSEAEWSHQHTQSWGEPNRPGKKVQSTSRAETSLFVGVAWICSICRLSLGDKGHRFLGVHLAENLTCSLNTSSTAKKAQQRLYFLRRLRKVHLPPPILITFYRGCIESISSSCIAAWFRNCTVSDRKTLQRLVRYG